MRKIKSVLILLLGSLILAGANPASAQGGIDAFWKKFRAAVVKKDKAAVASMAVFPLSMPYGSKSVRSKRELIKRYDEIFYGEADAAKCFQASPLNRVSAKAYEISCGFKEDTIGDGGEPIIYSFRLTKYGWRFSGLDNINE